MYNYYGARKELEATENQIHWPGEKNEPPLDEPYCGFKQDNPICQAEKGKQN